MQSFLILHNNNGLFLNKVVMWDEDWILHDNWRWPDQWLDPEEAPKHFQKPNLNPKKVMVTGVLLPVWSTTAFWILVKPLHMRSMLSKLMRCIENCSASADTDGPSSPRQHPTIHCTTSASKVEWIELQSIASSIIFTWPLTNRLLLLQASRQLFAGRMLPQPAGGRKCFPRVCWIPKHGFSLAKMFDCNGSYFE